MFIIRLIKKYVFAVSALRRPFFKYTFFTNPVFGTKSLPKNRAHSKNKMSLTRATGFDRIYTDFGSHIVLVGL